MDLKQLEYFVRVAELGSFTKAAIALNVAQPAISRQIRLLEVELRVALLARNGRGAVPTEAGHQLLAHGRGILHQIERAKEDLSVVSGSLGGKVAIGMPFSLARVLTVPLTRAFKEHMPQAMISISEGLTASMQEGLKNGALDIALLYNAQSSAEVDIKPLFEEELFLIEAAARRIKPLRLKELAQIPLIIPTRPNAIRMHLESAMAHINRRLQIALEIDGVSGILDLVANGAGAAVLSRHAVANSVWSDTLSINPIIEPTLSIRTFMAHSALRPQTHTQTKAMALIEQTVMLMGLTPQQGVGG